MRDVAQLDSAILMSMISRVELEGGVYREPAHVAIRRARLDVILSTIPALAFDADSSDAYRDMLARMGYSRRKLLDRMIGAQAIVHQATLVTKNQDDFSDIPGLSILAW